MRQACKMVPAPHASSMLATSGCRPPAENMSFALRYLRS